MMRNRSIFTSIALLFALALVFTMTPGLQAQDSYSSKEYIEEAYPYVNSADWLAVAKAFQQIGKEEKAAQAQSFAQRLEKWEKKVKAQKKQEQEEKQDQQQEQTQQEEKQDQQQEQTQQEEQDQQQAQQAHASKEYIEEAYPYVNSADWLAVAKAFQQVGKEEKAAQAQRFAQRLEKWEKKVKAQKRQEQSQQKEAQKPQKIKKSPENGVNQPQD